MMLTLVWKSEGTDVCKTFLWNTLLFHVKYINVHRCYKTGRSRVFACHCSADPWLHVQRRVSLCPLRSNFLFNILFYDLLYWEPWEWFLFWRRECYRKAGSLNSSYFSVVFPLVWQFLYGYCFVAVLRALSFWHVSDHVRCGLAFLPDNIWLSQSYNFQIRKKMVLFAASCRREALCDVLQCTRQVWVYSRRDLNLKDLPTFCLSGFSADCNSGGRLFSHKSLLILFAIF